MKRFLIALLALMPAISVADTCGPGTTLAWDYQEPLPANVDGFRVYANDVEVWAGTTLEATPDLGAVEETKTFYVVAYNDAAESAQSNTVSCDFVTGAPAAVLNLRFLP